MRLREGRHRQRLGKLLIDGIRELDRAVQAGVRILEIFTVLPSVAYKNTNIHQVSESVMRKIAFGDRNEGIVAVAEEPAWSFDAFEAKIKERENPLFAVLVGVEKPGNLGAVVRCADAAGMDGVIIADSLVDPFHSNSIRSSMGTVFSIPMASESSAVVLRWLKGRRIQIAAAWCIGNTVPYTAIDFRQPTAFVLGNEAVGLPELWKGETITSISLPMLGIADSLNVSVAAGVLFYEARRQRTLQATE